MAHTHRRRTSTRCLHAAAAFGALAAVVLAATASWAIKWPAGCPTSRSRMIHAGSRMFASSPFVHPGHEVGFFLRDGEAERRGGFSIEPGGNTIEIVFRPVTGEPIPLPAFTATAADPSALYFTFPDTRELLGRIVAGPMDVTVRTGNVVRRGRRPVALPPANHVLTMLEHGHDVTALGAVDAAGRLWIPLEFSGFGPGMPMPMCPVELTQKTAFAVRLVPTLTDIDDFLPHVSYANMRNAKLFFGDFLLNGINVYGEDTGSALDVRELNRAAVICGMNDALSLVLMVRLKESAMGPRSRVLPIVKDGSPLPIEMANVSGEPVVANQLAAATEDSFGNQCAPPGDD
jgi:hypothetical protein